MVRRSDSEYRSWIARDLRLTTHLHSYITYFLDVIDLLPNF